ncbi:MAG: hypothetical protein EBU46_09155 [Nitrosomonadaceae bacterium]|nr:hypothetical protein [Nitrosomonadaceae bacterium]
MINVKKGSAHSLQQTDKVGLAKANEGVVAGMVCRINTSNEVVKGPTDAAAADDLLGFAINNQTDGDVIESGKISLYLLDGSSVIETDQSTATINATNYPVGTRVAAIPDGSGKVRPWQSGDRVIGYVEGVRDLPSNPSVSQDYLDLAGNTKTKTQATQKMIKVVAIKLAA